MQPFVPRGHSSRFLLGIWALVGALGAGCAHPLPLPEYRAWLADPAHGLTHSREANGATVGCSYRPIPLLVQQELAGVAAPTPATRDSLARVYAGKTYCALSLARGGAEIENSLVTEREPVSGFARFIE